MADGAKCCGPVWIEESFQNLIFVGLISCGKWRRGSPGLWMGCCSLASFMFSVGFTSHQPLSRRGCCKVKSVRDFGDIMDEWSQVEWSCCQKETPFILNRNLKRSHDQQILDQFQVIYEDVVKATFLESWTVSSIKVSHHQLITTLLNLIIRAKPMTLTFLSQAAATDPWPPLPEPRLDSQVNKNNGMYFLPYS